MAVSEWKETVPQVRDFISDQSARIYLKKNISKHLQLTIAILKLRLSMNVI